jgi:hypothetical protein
MQPYSDILEVTCIRSRRTLKPKRYEKYEINRGHSCWLIWGNIFSWLITKIYISRERQGIEHQCTVPWPQRCLDNHPKTDHETWKKEYGYTSTHSLTSALDAGGWTTPHTGRSTVGKGTQCSFYRRLCGQEGRPGQVRKMWPKQKFDPRTV